jgi:hypothetical protein
LPREKASPASRQMNVWKSPLGSPSKREFSEISTTSFLFIKNVFQWPGFKFATDDYLLIF